MMKYLSFIFRERDFYFVSVTYVCDGFIIDLNAVKQN